MSLIAACSGSVAMVNALRKSGKLYKLPNKDALSGDRIHWWLATTPWHLRENLEASKQLSGYEIGTARKAREIQLELINAWYGKGRPSSKH